jgi:Sigma-54 interaction domain
LVESSFLAPNIAVVTSNAIHRKGDKSNKMRLLSAKPDYLTVKLRSTLLGIASAIAISVVFAQTEPTATTTTTGTGTITEYSPDSAFVVREKSGLVSYRYGDKVTYVTRSGKTLTDDQVSRIARGRVLAGGWRSDDPANVRIVCATNKNLEEEVAQKKFREDLFYRLNVVRIHLPPLRSKQEDIRQLAEYFLQKIAHQKHRQRIVSGERFAALVPSRV